MTTLRLTTTLVLTTSSSMAITGHANPATHQAGQAARRQLIAGRFVTVVTSKAPWYAFNFVLARAFRKVVPVYQQVEGLQFKAFSHFRTAEGNYLGGIYLWQSETKARRWFTPDWFAEIERKRGQMPTVAYFPLISEHVFVPENFDYRRHETTCVTLHLHALTSDHIQQCLTRQPGLLRAYVVAENTAQGAILLFASARDAHAFLKQNNKVLYDWFRTPTLLNNAQPQQP